MTKGMDPRCYGLAEVFLEDGTHAEKLKLGQRIQDAIEDWLTYDRCELPEQVAALVPENDDGKQAKEPEQ